MRVEQRRASYYHLSSLYRTDSEGGTKTCILLSSLLSTGQIVRWNKDLHLTIISPLHRTDSEGGAKTCILLSSLLSTGQIVRVEQRRASYYHLSTGQIVRVEQRPEGEELGGEDKR